MGKKIQRWYKITLKYVQNPKHAQCTEHENKIKTCDAESKKCTMRREDLVSLCVNLDDEDERNQKRNTKY